MNLVSAPAVHCATVKVKRILKDRSYQIRYALEINVYVPNASGQGDVERLFEVKVNGKWVKFDTTAKKPAGHETQTDKIMDNATWTLLPGAIGYKLALDINDSFKGIIKQNELTYIRVAVRLWPKGKGKTLFPGSTEPYSLPDRHSIQNIHPETKNIGWSFARSLTVLNTQFLRIWTKK